MTERKGSDPTVEEMRADLKARCARIPIYTWRRFFPDFQIPMTMHTGSPLLPSGVPYGSHEVDGYGKKLEVPNVVGNDVVETFIARNGRILEKLVHYKRDGYDSEKRDPDEVLGEVSDEEYQREYKIAVDKLEWFEKMASETSSSVSS